MPATEETSATAEMPAIIWLQIKTGTPATYDFYRYRKKKF
jgi:hypothetical protein